MITADSIHPIIAILKKEARRLKVPAVGLIAQRTQDPFQVLISRLLSFRTRDETSEAASAFRLAATPNRMLGLRVDQIESAIYPVSFYRNKTKQILGICRDLIEKFDGNVPDAICEISPYCKQVGVEKKR